MKNSNIEHNVILILAIYISVGITISLSSASVAFGQMENDIIATANVNSTTYDGSINKVSNSITFHYNIEKIKGHLEQAIINKESGNNTLTVAHTLHPIAEIYSLIEKQISETNPELNTTLYSELIRINQEANNLTVDQFREQANNINGLLIQAIDEVIPQDEQNNNTHNLEVMVDLLRIASHEYEETVMNGTVKAMIEYQDAQAFINRSNSILNSISNTSAGQNEKIQEIEELFSSLNNSVLRKENIEVVEDTINSIISKISEMSIL